MDTEHNKKTLELANAAVSRGDHEGFLFYCTEDTKWNFVGQQILEGKESVRQYMAETYIEPPQFEVKRLVAEGNMVVAIGKISLKNKNGKMANYSYCDIWTFREGIMHELSAFVVAVDQGEKLDEHAGVTVIGSGFSYDEAERPSDESLPVDQVNDQDIVNLPDLGQLNRP